MVVLVTVLAKPCFLPVLVGTFMEDSYHSPVMVKEILEMLIWNPDGQYVDATIGGGGHSLAILETYPQTRIIGIDKDPDAINHTEQRLKLFKNRVTLVQSDFKSIYQFLPDNLIAGFLFDLGVSSYQLDNTARGFSFMHPSSPLDMRMSQEGITAANWLKSSKPEVIKEALYKYGDFRFAQRLTNLIVENRGKINTSGDLCRLIEKIIPYNINPLKAYSQVFQALRIAINDELRSLKDALSSAPPKLTEGGIIVILYYHSGEQRVIQETFKNKNITQLTKHPLEPTQAELNSNPRARSARLLAYRKVSNE
jgi:16S rRNA (cytosine1402-N4)-methyltransferase